MPSEHRFARVLQVAHRAFVLLLLVSLVQVTVVLRQVVGTREAGPARDADVGPFAGVRPGVVFQVGVLAVPLSARAALEGLLIGVNPLVHPELLGLPEQLAALRTSVRLVSRMDQHVLPQGLLLPEGLVANVALVWFQPQVYAPVHVEVVGTAEDSAALWTLHDGQD